MKLKTFVVLAAVLVTALCEAQIRIRRSFSSGTSSFGGGASVSYPVDSRVAETIAQAREGKYAKGIKFAGKVLRVSDGDSFWLVVGSKREKVRLYGVDAPESNQPFEKEAKRALKNLIGGKSVVVESQGRDANDRILGKVMVGDIDVNLWMLENGYAWCALKSGEERSWQEAFEKARENKLGLWGKAGPVSPWQWRASRKVSH